MIQLAALLLSAAPATSSVVLPSGSTTAQVVAGLSKFLAKQKPEAKTCWLFTGPATKGEKLEFGTASRKFNVRWSCDPADVDAWLTARRPYAKIALVAPDMKTTVVEFTKLGKMGVLYDDDPAVAFSGSGGDAARLGMLELKDETGTATLATIPITSP